MTNRWHGRGHGTSMRSSGSSSSSAPSARSSTTRLSSSCSGSSTAETRHTASDHQPDTGHQLLATVVGVGHHHFVAGGVRIALHRLIDVEEKGILHVGDDHPDGAALPAGEVAGVEVGMILQFFDCLDYSRAGGSLDDACIVQDPRDRSGGDLGAAGHLFEVHVPNIVTKIFRVARFGGAGEWLLL